MTKNAVRLDKAHNILWTRTVCFKDESDIEQYMSEMAEGMEQLSKGFLVIDDISQFTYDTPDEVFDTWAMLAEIYDYKIQTRIGKVIRIYGGNDSVREVWQEASDTLKAGVPIYFQPSFT